MRRLVVSNKNEAVGSDITYHIQDDNPFALEMVSAQNPRILKEELEVIHTQVYKLGDLFRTAVDGCGRRHSCMLLDTQVIFRWVKGREGYFRCYNMSADVMVACNNDDWEVCVSAKGNHTLVNIEDKLCSGLFYHICTDLTPRGRAGELVRFTNWGQVERDMITFDAKAYHYSEFMEDILGVAG